MDQHRLIERLFYFDGRAILLPESLVKVKYFLPEIAHMMRHLAFLGGLLDPILSHNSSPDVQFSTNLEISDPRHSRIFIVPYVHIVRI